MTATPEKIKSRIRKLLSLAKSANVNEAAVAAANAQALIDQHNIDLAMLDEEESKELFEEEVVADALKFECFSTAKNVVAWKWSLLWDICKVNDCKPWTNSIYDEDTGYRRHFHAVGRPSDALQVVELFQFVVAQIEHLAKTCDDEKRREGETKRAYLNSFRHGAGSEVGSRLLAEHSARRKQLKEDAEAAMRDAEALEAGAAKDTALVVANTSLVRTNTALARLDKRVKKVEHYMKFKKMKYSSGSQSYTGTGFSDGHAAGKNVRTSTGQKAIG